MSDIRQRGISLFLTPISRQPDVPEVLEARKCRVPSGACLKRRLLGGSPDFAEQLSQFVLA